MNNVILTQSLPHATRKAQKPLVSCFRLHYIKSAFNKAPQNGLANSFYHLSLAHSTPISYACFFVHSVYAHPNIDLFSDRLCPMVTRSGKGLNLCRLPVITDLRPVTRYRPKSRKVLAVTLENLITGVTQMTQFIFAAIRRTDLTNRIQKINATNTPNTQKPLVSCFRLHYIKFALAKSKAGHCKIVFIHKANSTPNRAFFVRSVYAPIQYSLFSDSLFSMVAHNGKGSALCRVPCVTVLQPVMCYRPSLQTLAVVPQNLHKDTAEMIYKFLCVNRTHPHFNLCVQTIQANNETNARLSLSADFQCLSLIAKINPKFDRTFAQGGIYA